MLVDSRLNRLLLTLLLLYLAGCAPPAHSRSRWLVSPPLLKHAGLEIVWDDQLPIKERENLARLSLLGDQIHALSSRNYLVALNRDTAEKIFHDVVAPLGFTLGQPVLLQDEFLCAIGSQLVEIDSYTGQRLATYDVDYGIVCPPAANRLYFYLAGSDHRVHVLRRKDGVELFEVAADDHSAITSVLADDQRVIFTTDGGSVVGMAPNRSRRLWQFDAAGPIIGPITREGNSLFFACRNMDLYRVEISDDTAAELVWKYQLPGLPEQPLRLGRDAVYQYVRSKGVLAVDKQTGRFLWVLPDGLELLAEAQHKAYLITDKPTLVVVDNLAGKKLYSVNFSNVDRYVANTADEKIYVADKFGRIVCIRPVAK